MNTKANVEAIRGRIEGHSASSIGRRRSPAQQGSASASPSTGRYAAQTNENFQRGKTCLRRAR